MISVVVSTATDYQTLDFSDEVACSESVVLAKEPVFEEGNYAHTLRTIDHMLREQKAEFACLFSSNAETKGITVSPPYTDVQRVLLHQRIAISLLATDHPIRTRYITHSYYVYTLERILI